jgi:hypothetical protein
VEERTDAADHGYAFLHQYLQLAAEADAEGRPNYKLRNVYGGFTGSSKLAGQSRDMNYLDIHHQAPFLCRMKWHSFQHTLKVLDDGGALNPRLWSCWTDEAFIGRMCKAAKGVHPATVGLRVLQRWILEFVSYKDSSRRRRQ